MRRLVFSALPGRKDAFHLAAVQLSPGQRTAPHTHDFPEVFLTLQGSAVHHWNGSAQTLGPGELVFIAAQDRHYFDCGLHQGLKLINLALAPEWWSHFQILLAPSASILPSPRKLSSRAQADASRRLQQMLAADRPEPVALLSTVSTLFDLLQPSAETNPPLVDADLAQSPEWLANLVRELDDATHGDYSISHWQRRSGRSPEHLARSCRKYLGTTLGEILNRARLRQVKRQLRAGDAKVADAAFAAGFGNLGHFYSTFRRSEGCSPKAWAKAQSGEATVPTI